MNNYIDERQEYGNRHYYIFLTPQQIRDMLALVDEMDVKQSQRDTLDTLRYKLNNAERSKE